MTKKNKSLKKIIGLMLILALTASMAACSGKKNTNSDVIVTPEVTVEPTAEPTEEPAEELTPTEEPEVTPEDMENGNNSPADEMTTAEKMHEALEIVEKQLEETVENEDGTSKLYHYTIEYPQIENAENLETIDQVNKLIEEEAIEAGKQYTDDDAAYAKESYEGYVTDNNTDALAGFPYSNTRTYEVTFNKNYLISIVYTDVRMAGGAYPVETRTSYTYDLLTGKKLEALDLMNMTEQEVYDMISQSFTTIINEEPDRFFEDAREIAVKEAPNAGFYLQDGCIMFYFNEDVLAPHAGGIQEFGSDISSIPESYVEPERLI